MPLLSRREFLESAAAVGISGGAAALAAEGPAQPRSSQEKIIVGVVGIRGRGSNLAQDFAARGDVKVAYLADVDTSLFDSRARLVAEAQGSAPRCVQDFRRVLDDAAVDAVVIATPDHWHALATVWACQAGKHVYVEKPVSHTPWEGRQMVAASQKYKRVVQAGLQNRSAPYNVAAREYLASGRLGSVHFVRVYNQKEWPNRPALPDEPAPRTLDWDMWTGPAPQAGYNRNYHDAWNHFWRFSGGDIINDGVHQLDLARWMIGKDYPRSVVSTGGRHAEAGVFETPDTQVAVYTFDDLVMTFELTLYTPYMLKIDPEVRSSDLFPNWLQCATRIEIYGTKGLMLLGRHGGGWQVFDRPRARQSVVKDQMFGRFPDDLHKQDFCDAIRGGRLPNADILEGHRSTLLCQFANISYRLGGVKLDVDTATESFRNSPEGNAMLKREYRSPWTVPDLS